MLHWEPKLRLLDARLRRAPNGWRSILVSIPCSEDGPKNPSRAQSMKPLVLAADAQSGVGAGGEGRQGDPQRHAGVDPAPVEAFVRRPCTQRAGVRRRSEHLHAVPGMAGAVCSVACLERWRTDERHGAALRWPLRRSAALKPLLQKRLGARESCRGKLLGCSGRRRSTGDYSVV